MTMFRGSCWASVAAAFLLACGSGGSDPVDHAPETSGGDVVVNPDKGQADEGVSVEDVRPEEKWEEPDTPDTETFVDPCPEGAAGMGCPCTSPGDCLSGLCIDTMQGQQCTIGCMSDDPCPSAWYCGVVAGSGTDVMYGCIDPAARLCQPCMKDQECVPALASTGFRYLCIEYGLEGSFCGVSCDKDADCPDGFVCRDSATSAGTLRQCRPAEDAACPCTMKYQQQGNLTECRIENEFGTCKAERTCDIECPARVPAAETCNAQDDDCNGLTDDDLIEEPCTLTNEWGTCPAKVVCKDGDAGCTGTAPAQEACNGTDDNCDGTTDEVGALNCIDYYRDEDKDGHGVEGETKCQCGPIPPFSATAVGDCQDGDPQVFVGATEVCNDKDDNCNSQTDEDGAQGCIPYYSDQDGDQYGVTADMKCLCKPSGLYTARLPGDCSDLNPAINPAAVETCDTKDNDCDGTADNENAQGCSVYFMDADGDKFGRTDTYKCLCTPQPPYTATQGQDCDDEDKMVRPTGVEICNGKDDNCDGVTDPPNTMGGTPYYKDQDADGYGSGTEYQVRCAPGDMYTSPRNDDCNDNDPLRYPTATEYCNAKDDDCDGTIDEQGAVGCNRFYWDEDGDTYGLTLKYECACGGVANGYYRATTDGDCNDKNVMIRPGAPEVCFNFIDDNCNGQTDEEGGYGCTQYYVDLDGDGASSDANNWKCLCTAEWPYTTTDGAGDDCCDQDGNVAPSQTGWFTSKNKCGNWDYNCSGEPEKQYRDLALCQNSFPDCKINRQGWTDSVPDCGGSGSWSTSCSGFLGGWCAGDGDGSKTQGCH